MGSAGRGSTTRYPAPGKRAARKFVKDHKEARDTTVTTAATLSMPCGQKYKEVLKEVLVLLSKEERYAIVVMCFCVCNFVDL